MEFSELEACYGAGLNMVDWIRGNYTVREKEMVLAWYRGHNLVQSHSNDASVKK